MISLFYFQQFIKDYLILITSLILILIMQKSIYDAVVIGAGHNGLVAANYLARANKKVLVL